MSSAFILQQELNREMQQYRNYLDKQKKEEERREKELDSILNIEVEKQWGQRLAQWRKEREARKKLLHDVVETRQKQIKEKCKLKKSTIAEYSNLFLFS